MMFSVVNFDYLEKLLTRAWSVDKAIIYNNDVFCITRLVHKSNVLTLFLTGHNCGKPYQFYTELKCDLYSYKKCHSNHFRDTCSNNCESYKSMVMPGVKRSAGTGPIEPVERINVIKYKRNENTIRDEKFALDSFLNDINRVHMQTQLKEGQYIRFLNKHYCINNKLVVTNRLWSISEIDTLLEIVDPSKLEREIVPVVACYDIETHSNGQRFSNAAHDFIISIGLVVKRNNLFTKICLFYVQDNDDMDEYELTNKGEPDNVHDVIYCIRFKNELNMLSKFFKLLPAINMDCLVDYNGDKFDLPFIIDRVNILSKINRNSNGSRPVAATIMKIKRYNLEPMPIKTMQLCDKFSNRMNTHFLVYFIHIDLYQFISIDSDQKDLENFQLNTVAEHYLNKKKVDLPITEMLNLYNTNKLQKIIEYNVKDCILPADLLLKLEILDFVYTQCLLLYLSTDDVLRNISHKVNVVFFNRALTNTRFDSHSKKHIPDKYFFNKFDLSVTSGRKRTIGYRDKDSNETEAAESSTTDDSQIVDLTLLKRKPVQRIPDDALRLCHQRQKCVFKGGKVLSPQPGLKHWVVTLDFSSLYLTIMIQEGICLSNVFIGHDKYVYLMRNQEAINPKLLENLLELRTMYKGKRDNFEAGSFQYNLYDKTQNSVKRIANSIYGYFGIFFKPLANHVTKIGRDKLVEAIKKIEDMSENDEIKSVFNLTFIKFKVIYGDTDSSFIHVQFKDDEISENKPEIIKDIVNNYVLKRLNSGWVGYKMALENIMTSLILLKKKKYCFLTIKNNIKYKGWLVKKDMPLFMRNTFKEIINMILKKHSVPCALDRLKNLMIEHYSNFGKNNNYMDYGFSMSYNENTTNKKATAKPVAEGKTTRKKPITIAKHCREILANSGTDFLPGNGDRIPYLLIDKEGSVTQKAFPLKLFAQAEERISWIKHIGILCNFFNEMIEIFGNCVEFETCFYRICSEYMSNQLYDVKYPLLKPIKPVKSVSKKKDEPEEDNDLYDDDRDTGGSDLEDNESIVVNHTHIFSLYKARFNKKEGRHMIPQLMSAKTNVSIVCDECNNVTSY